MTDLPSLDSQREQLRIALRCNLEGEILEVIRDQTNLEDSVSSDQPFPTLLDPGSISKGLDFLDTLRQKGATFGWEMNVPTDDGTKTLHFAGGRVDDQLFVAGAATDNDLMELYDELMGITNEQANELRAAVKQCTEISRRAQRGSDLYDEISRLNNQLVAMQRELARKNAELERLNEQKNQFLGMAAHDLRNPLHVISGYSEFLRDEASETLPERYIEFLSIIHSTSRFMEQMVDDLLDVTEIESGKLTLNLQPTDLNRLVEENVQVNRSIAAQKDIEIDLQAHSLPTVLIDPHKIEQVLNNLISNAIKYSPPHSTIRVRLRYRESDEEITLAVEDEGPGIPEGELDRLFTPFETTSVQATGGERSTGLGLVIVKRIVEGHQGTIEVDSEVNKGTTFRVRLPLRN